MGVSISEVTHLLNCPHLAKRSLRVLDIGSQNLCNVHESEVVEFIRARNDVYQPDDLAAYARMLSAGSTIDPEFGGINGAWLGDLLTRCGFEYMAFDIFEGYRTQIFDLNTEPVPANLAGTFDLVLNCGTTEHILNQVNAFRVIHDAASVGGVIYHAVPMTGHLDHGYFNYNPLLFVELAETNHYEILEIQFNGPEGYENVADRLVSQPRYANLMPRLAQAMARWKTPAVPIGNVGVLLRKTSSEGFRLPMEVSTVPEGSEVDPTGRGTAEPVSISNARIDILQRERELVNAVAKGKPQLSELQRLHSDHMKVMPRAPFPLRIEAYMLEESLRIDPSRDDLVARLRAVNAKIRTDAPLLSLDVGALPSRRLPVLLDGQEVSLLRAARDAFWLPMVVDAYRQYFREGREDEFPAELEYEALVASQRRDDKEVKLRIGHLLSKLTVAAPLRLRGATAIAHPIT